MYNQRANSPPQQLNNSLSSNSNSNSTPESNPRSHRSTELIEPVLPLRVIVSNTGQVVELLLPYSEVIHEWQVKHRSDALQTAKSVANSVVAQPSADHRLSMHLATPLRSATATPVSASVAATAMPSQLNSLIQQPHLFRSNSSLTNVTNPTVQPMNSSSPNSPPNQQTSGIVQKSKQPTMRQLQQIVMSLIRARVSPHLGVPETHQVLLTVEHAKTSIQLPNSLLQAAIKSQLHANQRSDSPHHRNDSPQQQQSEFIELFLYDRGWTDDWIDRHSAAVAAACEQELQPLLSIGAPLLLPTMQSTSVQVIAALQQTFPHLLSRRSQDARLSSLVDSWLLLAHNDHIVQIHVQHQSAVERAVRQCIQVCEVQLRALQTALLSVRQFGENLRGKCDASIDEWQEQENQCKINTIERIDESLQRLAQINVIQSSSDSKADSNSHRDSNSLLHLINESEVRLKVSNLVSDLRRTASRHAALQSSCAAVEAAIQHIEQERIAKLESALQEIGDLIQSQFDDYLLPGCASQNSHLNESLELLHEILAKCELQLSLGHRVDDLTHLLDHASSTVSSNNSQMLPWFMHSYATMLEFLSARCLPLYQENLVTFYNLMASMTRISADMTSAMQQRTAQQARQDELNNQCAELHSLTIDFPRHYASVLVEHLRRQHVQNRIMRQCTDFAREMTETEQQENFLRSAFADKCGRHLSRPVVAAIGSSCGSGLTFSPLASAPESSQPIRESETGLCVADEPAPHVALHLSPGLPSHDRQTMTVDASQESHLTIQSLNAWLAASRSHLDDEFVDATHLTLNRLQQELENDRSNGQTPLKSPDAFVETQTQTDLAAQLADQTTNTEIESASVEQQTSISILHQLLEERAAQTESKIGLIDAATITDPQQEPEPQPKPKVELAPIIDAPVDPTSTMVHHEASRIDHSTDSSSSPPVASKDRFDALAKLQSRHEEAIRKIKIEHKQAILDLQRRLKEQEVLLRQSRLNCEHVETSHAKALQREKALQSELAASNQELHRMSVHSVASLQRETDAWREAENLAAELSSRLVYEFSSIAVGECVLLCWSPRHLGYTVWTHSSHRKHGSSSNAATDEDEDSQPLIVLDHECLQQWKQQQQQRQQSSLLPTSPVIVSSSSSPPFGLLLPARITHLSSCTVQDSAHSHRVGMPIQSAYVRCKAARIE